MSTYFIAGIDTDTGKTITTGLIAKYLHKEGKSIITQKFAQTGCKGISEDILEHRKIMNLDLFEEDLNGLTCPFVFDYPASPHLAAELQKIKIDINQIDNSTKTLEQGYEYVLLEGVGGLSVPLTMDYTTLDFLEEKQYPTILVSSSKLGSINHTLLSLELLKNRNIPLSGLIYNHYPAKSEIILKDSIKVFRHYLKKFNFNCPIIEIPVVENLDELDISFGKLFI